MARYIEANCKLCRREGTKLFLKGTKCLSDKCPVERRAYPPGQHGQSMRRKPTEYAVQLREKQKARRIYGVLEAQFRRYYQEASRKKGVTGEALLQLLETRLDNLVYRLGFAPSRKAARQLIRHRHFMVNERIVDIPSCRLKPSDSVQVHEGSRQLAVIHDALAGVANRSQVSWLHLDKAALKGTLLEIPARADIPTPIQEQLIIEFYSK